MIINHYKGTNYTPVDIATKLYNAGYMNTSTYLGSNGDSFLVVKVNLDCLMKIILVTIN